MKRLVFVVLLLIPIKVFAGDPQSVDYDDPNNPTTEVLRIAGSATIGPSTSTASVLITSNSVNAPLFNGAGTGLTGTASSLSVSTASYLNTLGLFYNGGNVGIGTTNPQATLDIGNGTLKTGGKHWEIIYSTMVTSAVNSVNVTGLDGNTDEEYRICWRFFNTANTGIQYIFRINNDNAGNYGAILTENQGGTLSGTQNNSNTYCRCGYVAAQNRVTFGETIIYAKNVNSIPRNIHTTGYGNSTQTGATAYSFQADESYTDTTTNITSIAFYSGVSGDVGIGVGSHIEIWAKR